MSDHSFNVKSPIELNLLVKWNWQPGEPASWDSPGDPPHPEDVAIFMLNDQGEETEVPMTRELKKWANDVIKEEMRRIEDDYDPEG